MHNFGSAQPISSAQLSGFNTQ